jgi:PAS domain S-box-containing protein
MSHHQKSRSDFNNEIARLKNELKALEGLRHHQPEDILTLSILEHAPFTVWACRRNFEIVLWNKRCEERYAYPKEKALGKNFFDLFVHEHEREQAKEDCLSIIDKGTVFPNSIADDHDSTGKQIKMLTNCFRVRDERYDEWVQAEIGVDISDFETSEDQHRTIREVGMKMHEMKVQTAQQDFLLQKGNLQLKLRDAYMDKIRIWQTMNDDALNLNRQYSELVNEDARQRIQQRVTECASIRTEIDSKFNTLDDKIFKVKVLDDLVELRKEVADFVAWKLPTLLYG